MLTKKIAYGMYLDVIEQTSSSILDRLGYNYQDQNEFLETMEMFVMNYRWPGDPVDDEDDAKVAETVGKHLMDGVEKLPVTLIKDGVSNQQRAGSAC